MAISLFNKIRQALSKKDGGPYPYLQSQMFLLNTARYSPATYRTYALQGYMLNPIVYRCINLIATAVAGVPWRLYRKLPDDKEIQIEQHPVLSLLCHPNPKATQADFITNVLSYLQLSGNVYVQAVGPVVGPPRELYTLRPDRIEIQGTDYDNYCDGMFEPVYMYSCNNTKIPLDMSKIWHGKLWNPICDFYGLSPLSAASKSIDQLNAALDWNVSLLQNCANPSGVLTAEGNLNDEQVTRLKEQMAAKYQSPYNAGRPMVLDGGLKWDQMSLTPHEMEWNIGQQLATKNICIALGVDPVLLGDSANRTYATYRDAEKSFYTSTVLPNLDRLRDEFLNGWLLPRFDNTEDMFFEYDKDEIEILGEDRTVVWDRVLSGMKEGLITLNEARSAIDYAEFNDEADNLDVNEDIVEEVGKGVKKKRPRRSI